MVHGVDHIQSSQYEEQNMFCSMFSPRNGELMSSLKKCCHHVSKYIEGVRHLAVEKDRKDPVVSSARTKQTRTTNGDGRWKGWCK